MHSSLISRWIKLVEENGDGLHCCSQMSLLALEEGCNFFESFEWDLKRASPPPPLLHKLNLGVARGTSLWHRLKDKSQPGTCLRAAVRPVVFVFLSFFHWSKFFKFWCLTVNCFEFSMGWMGFKHLHKQMYISMIICPLFNFLSIRITFLSIVSLFFCNFLKILFLLSLKVEWFYMQFIQYLYV